MSKIIKREDIIKKEIETDENNYFYRDFFREEKHHDHEVVQAEDGRYHWKEDPIVSSCIDNLNLNHLIPLFGQLGIGKNSEIYRKMYRDMGYSLNGYWEIFHWDINNPYADDYEPGEVPKPIS